MVARGHFGHVLNGKDAGDRIRAAGYEWSRWGENIAAGFDDEADVFQAWMHSPEGHRRNVLNPAFVHTGFGRAVDARGRVWWCAVFARR